MVRPYLVVTHRPEWTAGWAIGLAQVTTLAIGRLTKQQIRELIESMIANVPVQLADRIAERTDGVPLFVEELTRSIQESGKAASLSIQNQTWRTFLQRTGRASSAID